MAAASHTPQTLRPQLLLHVCDHFLLISLPQKRKLYLLVNGRNRVDDMKSKTCSSSFQARLDFMFFSFFLVSFMDEFIEFMDLKGFCLAVT